MEIIELNREEFIEFSTKYPYSTFFQSPYWIDIKKENGWDGKIVGVKKDNKIIAATILLFKNIKFINKKIVYAPRGFLLDYSDYNLLEEFTLTIKKYLKKEKALFLKINPYVKYCERTVDGEKIENSENDKLIDVLKKLGYIHQGFYVTMNEKKDLEPRWLSVLNLENKTSDEILSTMRPTTRQSVRNSMKNSLRIIECEEKDLEEFKSLMEHTANRRNFIDRPLSYYKNLYNTLIKDNLIKVLLVEINFENLKNEHEKRHKELEIKLNESDENSIKPKYKKELIIEKESLEKRIKVLDEYIDSYGKTKIIAGGLYMLYGRQVVYLFGASYKEFMKYRAQYLLQWEMINYAIDNKYQTFNFYGIDGDFREESENFGLFDFKRGFGSEVVELIGEFDLVINKMYYKLYNIAFKMYNKLKSLKLK